MKGKLIKLGILSAAFVLFAALVGNLLPRDSMTGDASGLILARPAFAQSVEASFLEEEAGIAAYVNVGQAIDLARAAGAYRTLEKETESYIIGSVALPDYDPSEDVHIYASKDGWIVAYYMKNEPVSKIIDWLNYSPGNINTKLRLGLEMMATVAGVPITNINYYHFDFPNANKLIIIFKSREIDKPARGAEIFKLTIPSGLVVYERAWLMYIHERRTYPGKEASLSIDGKLISELDLGVLEYSFSSVDSKFAYGTLPVAHLAADVTHDVSLYTNYSYARAGITLVYQEL